MTSRRSNLRNQIRRYEGWNPSLSLKEGQGQAIVEQKIYFDWSPERFLRLIVKWKSVMEKQS